MTSDPRSVGEGGQGEPLDPHRGSVPGSCRGPHPPDPLNFTPQPLTPGNATGCASPETEVWLRHCPVVFLCRYRCKRLDDCVSTEYLHLLSFILMCQS